LNLGAAHAIFLLSDALAGSIAFAPARRRNQRDFEGAALQGGPFFISKHIDRLMPHCLV